MAHDDLLGPRSGRGRRLESRADAEQNSPDGLSTGQYQHGEWSSRMAKARKRQRSCQTTDPQSRASREGAEETYRLLFDRNPAPMFVFDEATLEILAANDAMVRDCGWTREELLGMTVRDIH